MLQFLRSTILSSIKMLIQALAFHSKIKHWSSLLKYYLNWMRKFDPRENEVVPSEKVCAATYMNNIQKMITNFIFNLLVSCAQEVQYLSICLSICWWTNLVKTNGNLRTLPSWRVYILTWPYIILDYWH